VTEGLRFGLGRKKRANDVEPESSKPTETTQVLSVNAAESVVSEAETMTMGNFKTTIERIKALEAERKNLLLEIDELKRMADAKAKALESEINMLRDEVKSLRILLSGEEMDSDLTKKKK
jgi:hypothetical protein